MRSAYRNFCLVTGGLALSCAGSSDVGHPGDDGAVADLGVTTVGDSAPPDASLDGGAPDGALPDAAHTAPPTPSDLQGAWYAEATTSDAGTTDSRRLLVRGTDYYETTVGAPSYCTEVGTVDANALGQVRFTPRQSVGVYCPPRSPRVGVASWTDTGIALAFLDGVVRYAHARAVPKLFVTVELHDGDFADDAALPGANAIEKADAFCNQSVARPDEQTYRALLVDGVRRSGAPPIDWVLKPDTTYFQADGVLNVLRTGADGLSLSGGNNSVLPELGGWERYCWTGIETGFATSHLTCGRWTANDTVTSGLVEDAAATNLAVGNVSMSCHDTATLLCVSR